MDRKLKHDPPKKCKNTSLMKYAFGYEDEPHKIRNLSQHCSLPPQLFFGGLAAKNVRIEATTDAKTHLIS